MIVIIDMTGDEETIIETSLENDPKEVARKAELRRQELEKLWRETPQPQVVPVEIVAKKNSLRRRAKRTSI